MNVVGKDIGPIRHLRATDSLAISRPAPVTHPRLRHLIRIHAYWFGRATRRRAIAVRLAIENARLRVQLRAQLDDVQRSRARLVEAADTERRRLERDLHDGAQQQLVTLLLSLQLAKSEALRRSDPTTAQMLDGSIRSLRQALDELRSLARGIHPTILLEAGLAPAIRTLAERCPIPVEVTGELERMEPRLEAALYFVAAEAMTNAVKHSMGQRIRVDIGSRSGWAIVDVSDDGVGGAEPSRGSGLIGLSDRLAAVGGRFKVLANQPRGTLLHAEVPYAPVQRGLAGEEGFEPSTF